MEKAPEKISIEEHAKLIDKYRPKDIEIVGNIVYRCAPGGNLYFITNHGSREYVISDKPGENTVEVYDKFPPECFDDMGGRNEAVHKYNLTLDKPGGTWTKVK